MVRDVEIFKPKVKRDDLSFASPVGEGEMARNRPSDLIGAKRALSNTGHFDFDGTREPRDEVGFRVIEVVTRFQTA